ncbi:MAG: MFS transporter [Proteobacteria bacterium]|nr:MFS transporter [Pseudomonadota bacterium]
MSDAAMNTESVKFGPVHLEPGVTRWNARTYMFSAFWTIGFLSFIGFLQNYVLRVHLNLPEDEIGRAVGTLSFVGEIAFIAVSPFFGSLSDKVGRRPIFALGFAWVGVGFFIYPLADSYGMLLLARGFLGIGSAALGGMMATVLSDYPQNRSRGIMAAMSGWSNGLGALFMIFLMSKLPSYFVGEGVSEQMAGTYTFWATTVLCMATAALAFKGLKAGKPGKSQDHKKVRVLIVEGAAAARNNPRIMLAYSESFIARGDLLMIGTFLSAWLIQAGMADGLAVPEATANAGRLGGLVQGVTLLWAPIFGIILDRFDRASVVIFAMALAVIGYAGIGLTADPTAPEALPALVMLGVGEFSAIMAGQALVAQEAPIDNRGAVLGLFAFCGALGLLALSLLGGHLFDSIGPGAPFLLVAGVNGIVLLLAIYVRRKTGYKSPGTR